MAIDGHELRPAPCLHVRVPSLVENEEVHPAGFGVPDPDPLLPPGVVHEVRLGVGHVNLILVIEEDSARRAELRPDGQELAVLVEELDAIVRPIGDEHAASPIDRDCVERAELAGCVPGLSPGLDELPVLRVLHDAVVAVDLVPVGDEDISVRSDGHGAGRREVILIVPRHACFPEGHQQLAVRAELEDLMAGAQAGFRRHGHAACAHRVGHPQIALAIDGEAVRPDEHPAAEALDDVALGVELEDRVDVLDPAVEAEAIDSEATAGGHRHGTRLVASDESPDALPVDVDVHGSRRSHLAAAGQPCPITAGDARAAAIRQSFDRAVRIGQPGGLREQRCSGHQRCEQCQQRGPVESRHLTFPYFSA